jgi:hypothetical protein
MPRTVLTDGKQPHALSIQPMLYARGTLYVSPSLTAA